MRQPAGAAVTNNVAINVAINNTVALHNNIGHNNSVGHNNNAALHNNNVPIPSTAAEDLLLTNLHALLGRSKQTRSPREQARRICADHTPS